MFCTELYCTNKQPAQFYSYWPPVQPVNVLLSASFQLGNQITGGAESLPVAGHVLPQPQHMWTGSYSGGPQSSVGGYQAPVGYASSPQPFASSSFTAATGVDLTLGLGNPHAGNKRTARASPGNSSSSSSDGVKLFGQKIGHSTSR